MKENINGADGEKQSKYILKSIYESSHLVIYSLMNNLNNFQTDELTNKRNNKRNLILEDYNMKKDMIFLKHWMKLYITPKG